MSETANASNFVVINSSKAVNNANSRGIISSTKIGFTHEPYIPRQSNHSAQNIPGVICISNLDLLSHKKIFYFTNSCYPVWFKEVVSRNIVFAAGIFHLHDVCLDFLKGNFSKERWEYFNECRKEMKSIFLPLVLDHLKFCCERNIESYFWKMLYYNLIEVLRQIPNHKSTLAAIIDDGLHFYLKLLKKVKQKFLDESLKEDHLNKYKTIAKVSSQKLLICLGDLSRYKAKILNNNEFTNAFKFYHTARNLIPSNGIPYNQLAVLSVYKENKLDAVYYHSRSLLSSNAIFSAKENLKILFDDIRKEYEEVKNRDHYLLAENFDKPMLREQTWLYPGCIGWFNKSIYPLTNVNTTRQNDKTYADESIQNFTSLYLYIIGKLFSGIGLEKIANFEIKLSLQLNLLLNRTPLMFSRQILLKMAALNIFVLEHNKENDLSKVWRYSFCILNHFFGQLVYRANLIIAKHNQLDIFGSELFDLNSLLQFIKVWCDWLSLHRKLWQPYQKEEVLALNPWLELQKLIFFAQKMEPNFILNKNVSEVLEEDQFLSGFSPILSKIPLCVQQKLPSELIQLQNRLLKISQLSQIFNESRSSLLLSSFNLDYSVMDNGTAIYKKNEQLGYYEKQHVQKTFAEKTDDKIKVIKENTQILQFSKLKRELEVKTSIIKNSNKVYEILQSYDSKVYIEVMPRYLLLDTNCFIDNFGDIQKLNQKRTRYTIIVPLIVVKELDGLSKGVKIERVHRVKQKKNKVHYFDDVSTRAMQSLEFIKNSKNNIRGATSEGSLIKASLFGLVKEMQVSNDDKILAAACALSKTLSSEKHIDGKCFIQTELVLVTTDRNLRVKALSRNLVVSEMKEIIHYELNFK